MSIIKINNFTKYYGNFKAVDDISFEIEEGTIVGFVGKNGAGKSTTIRALLNFIHPTSGTCEIKALNSIKNSKQIRKYVSYMPSDAAFYANTTSHALLKFCANFSNVGFDVVQDLANYFELDLSKKITELSLGNRKKVSIIQALIKDADLLVLDEPTSGLDPLMQEKFFDLILEKKKQGKTIFLSSHNLIEIERYCDRAIIIKDGKIIDDIDIDTESIYKSKIIYVQQKDQTELKYEFNGDLNKLIQDLSKLDIVNLEIRNKSVEDEFIKYYKEENQ